MLKVWRGQEQGVQRPWEPWGSLQGQGVRKAEAGGMSKGFASLGPSQILCISAEIIKHWKQDDERLFHHFFGSCMAFKPRDSHAIPRQRRTFENEWSLISHQLYWVGKVVGRGRASDLTWLSKAPVTEHVSLTCAPREPGVRSAELIPCWRHRTSETHSEIMASGRQPGPGSASYSLHLYKASSLTERKI